MSLPPDLAALYASFARSNDEINSFQLPRLQSCSSDSQLADYDAELNSSIDGLKRTLNQLELAVDESESAQERTAVLQAVNTLKKHLEQSVSPKSSFYSFPPLTSLLSQPNLEHGSRPARPSSQLDVPYRVPGSFLLAKASSSLRTAPRNAQAVEAAAPAARTSS